MRFNELYLACRVEVDTAAEQNGTMKSSDFARVYEAMLGRSEIDACRVIVKGPEDLGDLKFKKKMDNLP